MKKITIQIARTRSTNRKPIKQDSAKRLPHLLLATLASLGGLSSLPAELITYTTRSDWEAAVSQSLFTETFDRFVSDANLRDAPVDLLDGAARISATNSYDTSLQRIDAPPHNGIFGGGGVDSAEMQNTFVFGNIRSVFDGTITLDFVPREGCHHAVGFDYSGAAGYLGAPPDVTSVTSYRVTTMDGNVTTVPFTTDDGFLGFLDADSPIVSVTILDTDEQIVDSVPRAGEGLALDNLTTSLADSDSDGMHDFYEEKHGLDSAADDSGEDPDSDGSTNLEESQRGTDPKNEDSDGDGLSDGFESGPGSTNPLKFDSDDDGMPDHLELLTFMNPNFRFSGTNPGVADSDGDGVLDGFEISQRSNPNSATSVPGGLAAGLVSKWDFNGHLNDLVGGNHAGEFDIRIPFEEGKFGQAADFKIDRSLLKITSGDESEFDFPGNSMSVSLWCRIDAFSTNQQTLIAKGNNSNGGWRLRRRDTTNRLTFTIASSSVADTGPDVADGEWHHVVAVAEAGVGMRLYVDGDLAASGPPISIPNTNFPLMIGAQPTVNGYNRLGSSTIDDVAIWERALTEAEISAIWNLGDGASIEDRLAAETPLQIDDFEYQQETGNRILTWVSRPEQSYAVDYSTDLHEWLELDDSIESTGAITRFVDDAVSEPRSPRLFYRIRVKD